TWTSSTATANNVIVMGTPPSNVNATSLSQLPSDVVFDRCYVHGTPQGNVRRGIAMNSARTSIVDSYFADFHEAGGDAQAIASWNGSGPFKIVNNYLEGAAENVLFGGADASIPNLTPSDIEIRANLISKPLKWNPSSSSYDGSQWTVKNLLELKHA